MPGKSRGYAARAVKRLHLRDLRREILVSAARNCLADAQQFYVSEADKARIINGLMPDIAAVTAQIKEWEKSSGGAGINVGAKKIRLDYLLPYGVGDQALSKITSEFVNLGIHPFDEVGKAKFDQRDWWQAFSQVNGESQFSNGLTAQQRAALSI
jgi:hypothetical protein